MNILIIEDEKPAARRLANLITAELPEARIYGPLDTITTSITWLNANPQPDLIFLDIQLADGISFEIFEQIKVSAPIIFCTAYDQYAIKAFKLNSIDYLLTPIDPEELSAALRKFESGRKEPAVSLEQIKSLLQPVAKAFKTRFLVKQGERILTIDVKDIAYFFSEDKVTLLQTHEAKKYIIDYTLDEVENMVSPEQFFRLNRKYVASIEAIKDVFTYSNSRLKIVLQHCADQDILVSREKVSAFKGWLGE
jgi:DNA-binding LytR/AlgR family response regulator